MVAMFLYGLKGRRWECNRNDDSTFLKPTIQRENWLSQGEGIAKQDDFVK